MHDLDCTLFYRVMFDIALAPGAEVGLPQALVAFTREYLYGSRAAGGLEPLPLAKSLTAALGRTGPRRKPGAMCSWSPGS